MPTGLQNYAIATQTCGLASRNSSAQDTSIPCKYKTGNVLGRGTYATVKEMVHIKTGQMYAGKVICRQRMRGNYQLIQNEIMALKALRSSPYIVSIIDHFESPNNSYLITEKCDGGELFEYIHRQGALEESEAVYVVKQIVSGVAYMHARGYIHRDLKTENCLIRTDQGGTATSIAIADFGMAYYIGNNKKIVTNICGTPGYMAPEMIQRSGHGKPVDMWAIGAIAYFALSGRNPFQQHGNQGSKDNRHAEVNGIYNFLPAHRWKHISSAAQDFIASLLVVDPNQRLTARQALQHPWLHSCNAPEPQLTSSMLNAYSQVMDTHSQISLGSGESAEFTNQLANARLHTQHKSSTSISSQATKVDQHVHYRAGAEAESQANRCAEFGQFMPGESAHVGIEGVFQQKSAEAYNIGHSSEETSADFTTPSPSGLSKLLKVQQEQQPWGLTNWLITPSASTS